MFSFGVKPNGFRPCLRRGDRKNRRPSMAIYKERALRINTFRFVNVRYSFSIKRMWRYRNFKQPAYAYFYNSKFKDENVIEFFRKLYRSNSLETFMEKGIKLLKDNEAEARTLIR